VLILVMAAVLLPSFNRPQFATATEISLPPAPTIQATEEGAIRGTNQLNGTAIVFQPEATAEVTAAPQAERGIRQLTRVYDTLLQAQTKESFPIFYPANLASGYVHLATEVRENQYVKSIFYQNQAYLQFVLQDKPYNTSADYLYLVQYPGTIDPRPIKHIFADSAATYTVMTPSTANYAVFEASTDDGQRAYVVVWRRDNWNFQMWSYNLNEIDLVIQAESVMPYLDSQVMPPYVQRDLNAIGLGSTIPVPHCLVDDMYPLERLEWQPPFSTGTYSVTKSFDVQSPNMILHSTNSASVLASVKGWVAYAGRTETGYGTMVVVWTGGYYVIYAHLDTITVNCGDFVQLGQQLATVSTGEAIFAEVLLEIMDAAGNRIDPATLIDFSGAMQMPTLPPTITPTPQVLCQLVVTNPDGVRIRSRADALSPQLGIAAFGAPMDVTQQYRHSDTSIWYFVRVTTDDALIAGWVRQDNLREQTGSVCPEIPE
jgi:hypothetical protein